MTKLEELERAETAVYDAETAAYDAEWEAWAVAFATYKALHMVTLT